MSYSVTILQDSISPGDIRLTTMEVTLPRIVLAEFNTHRVFSRNSASSRAIPVKKSIEMVREDPFIPEVFAQNQPGMQGNNPLESNDAEQARKVWHQALEDALFHASRLEHLGVHKALANRILEPFKWQTIIVTATEWSNFFALRTDKNAQPEIRKAAEMMLEQYQKSEPWVIDYDQWHLPLLGADFPYDDPNPDWDYWKKVSVGRCARVSYLTHDGKRDPDKDVELHDKLKTNRHLSPFEHVATPLDIYERPSWSGNFRGWFQYRKEIPFEDDYSKVISNGTA